jgi:peptidoglycan/LPS O-acetylase OafA/YrhL
VRSERDHGATARFTQLDALRFFFAAAVVVVHTLGFKSTLPHGGFAVDFFFILSGFVLSHALIRRSVSPGHVWRGSIRFTC